MHKTLENLRKKGWKEHDIAKAEKLIFLNKQKNHPLRKLDAFFEDAMVLLVLFGNSFIFIGFLPIFLKLNEIVSLFIFSIAGLGFGLVIDNLIRSIGKANFYEYAGILIPFATAIIFLVIYKIAKLFILKLGLILEINILVITLVYLLAFSLPHLYRLKGEK